MEGFRRSGGTLHIDSLDIAWEHFSASGSGTLSLGAHRGVQGFLDFQVSGIATLLEAAARRHASGGVNQGIAAALLDNLKRAGSSQSGRPQAVLGFHDGVVSVGNVTATTEEPLY